MTNHLFLDIETLPTDNAEHIAEIAASITPPGNISKAETIAAWEAEKRPALIAEAVAKTGFNGAYGRVCCVGWAWNDGAAQSVDLSSITERAMLRHAVSMIEETRPRHEAFHQTVIVGHYVADFDLRFLWQRAFVHGIRMPSWWPRDPKPWSKEVQDTMAMWAGAKASISLGNLAKALGIESQSEIDGSMVADMWKRGEHEAVAEYCRSDVQLVRQVYIKMMVAIGDEL